MMSGTDKSNCPWENNLAWSFKKKQRDSDEGVACYINVSFVSPSGATLGKMYPRPKPSKLTLQDFVQAVAFIEKNYGIPIAKDDELQGLVNEIYEAEGNEDT